MITYDVLKWWSLIMYWNDRLWSIEMIAYDVLKCLLMIYWNDHIWCIKIIAYDVLKWSLMMYWLIAHDVSNIVYWDKPPPLFQDLAPPLVVVITPKYRTYTYHTWYGVRAVIFLCYINYKPLSYSSPFAINSRIHCSCFTRE